MKPALAILLLCLCAVSAFIAEAPLIADAGAQPMPPMPPTNAVSTNQQEAVNVPLAWTASTNANVAGYTVYYGTPDGGLTNSIDAGTNCWIMVSNVPCGVTNFYTAVAYDTNDDESTNSNIVTYCAPCGGMEIWVVHPAPRKWVMLTMTNAILKNCLPGQSNTPFGTATFSMPVEAAEAAAFFIGKTTISIQEMTNAP